MEDPLPLKEVNLVMETENLPNKIKFQWSIRNVHKLPGVIRSSKFSLVPGHPCDWDVSIRCESGGDKFEFSLNYNVQRGDATPIRVESCSRILKNGITVVVRDCEKSHLFNVGDSRPLVSEVAFPKKSEDDKLVFQCSMTAHGYGSLCTRKLNTDHKQEIEDLRNGYLALKLSEEFVDLRISCGNKKFLTAHSCILKHLAPMFLSIHRLDVPNWEFELYESGMFQRSEYDRISDVYSVILRSIYSGEVERNEIKKHVLKFYRLSARYKLPSLRRACIREFAHDMDIDNVTVFYHLAEQGNDNELKNLCIEFINDNLQELSLDIIYIHFRSTRQELPYRDTQNDQQLLVL